jgi:hypothetical protein
MRAIGALQHNGVDSRPRQQVRQQQPRGAGADDPDLCAENSQIEAPRVAA